MASIRNWGLVGLLVGATAVSGIGSYLFGGPNSFSRNKSDTVVGRPLDLPNGRIGRDEEDEDELEAIVFYGVNFEGSSYVWCLDRSGSMDWGSPQPLGVLKQEVIEAIGSLSPDSEIGIVSYASDDTKWRPDLTKATPVNKQSAAVYVNSMIPSGLTCLAPAGVEMVNLSNQSRRRVRDRVMIVVGDGVPYCGGDGNGYPEQCLTDITNANYKRTSINTVMIGNDQEGGQFMQQLASANNGTYTQVNN